MTAPDLRHRCLQAVLGTVGADVDTSSDLTKGMAAFVDAVLAVTEADKAEAVAHERRRVVAEARRALVSPWTGDPGAGPRYVMATCLRNFDRLMELLPATPAVGNDGLTDTERAEYAERWRTGQGALPSIEASLRIAARLGITVDTNPKEN